MFKDKHQASFSATENNETFGVKKMTSGAKRINLALTMCEYIREDMRIDNRRN
jgi:hypothetical protein